MRNSRHYEWRVGLFVLIGLVLLGLLMLQFSKGWGLLTPTYPLTLKTANVGGIKRGAGVLMAGVPIGTVVNTDLDRDGKSVIINVKIFKRYPIHQDALFQLEQSGFLGDQYVSVLPQNNQASLLQAGDVVVCKEPFNLQDAARSAVRLMQQLDQAAATLDKGMRRVDTILLTEKNLTNVTRLVANLREVSEQAKGTVAKLDRIVEASAAPVGLTLTNLARLSGTL